MAQLLPFAVASRRRPDPIPSSRRLELMATISDLHLITRHRPLALTICRFVAKHYADQIRRSRT